MKLTLRNGVIVDDVVVDRGGDKGSDAAVWQLLSSSSMLVAVQERSGSTGPGVRRCLRIGRYRLQHMIR